MGVETMGILNDYFKARAGANAASLTVRDQEVAALRKMGFTGTLGDMRRAFYQTITGDSFLADAKAKFKSMNPRIGDKNFVGKVKADGDNSRLIYYGSLAAGFTNVSQFSAEASGYSLAAAKEATPNPLFYETSFANFVGFNFRFTLGDTKANLQRNVKSMVVNVNTIDADLFVWNPTTVQFVKVGSASSAYTDLSIDLLGMIDDVIDANGGIQFLVQTKTKGDGVVMKRLNVDFLELKINYFK